MKKDERVGYMTTSILEGLCKEIILTSWNNKDYAKFNDYVVKYITLKEYNNGKT